MGQIYAICGCSGVGKTTFLNKLFSSPQDRLNLLLRTTDREKRPSEKEGVDYYYLPRQDFLVKIFSNDFVHIEEYDDNYYGIEARYIEDTIKSSNDGIIMAGAAGATKLKAVYGANITIVFVHSGTRASLMDPRCLNNDFDDNVELARRLIEKTDKGVFTNSDTHNLHKQQFVNSRMQNNLLDLALINGRIRSGEQIEVIENLKGKLDDALNQFNEIRSRKINFIPHPYTKTNVCFVLMPFSAQYKPVYDDHIVNVLKDLRIPALRADGIFSTNSIYDDIIDALKNARIVIADLTSNNPNVFFEIGFCKALGKDVILIKQNGNKRVPFDLQHIRHISYDFTPRGMAEFENRLKLTIQTILNS